MAESVKDHASALHFSADENRAKRWISLGFWASIMDILFSATSNYGQSVARPVCWLLSISILITAGFVWASPTPTTLDTCINSTLLAATHIVSFLPITKDIASSASKNLFGNTLPPLAAGLSMLHGFLSYLFLFLIGLGLRNRFRL